jgi:outer membrane protein OmpA-like peptidoglycan-associated protein
VTQFNFMEHVMTLRSLENHPLGTLVFASALALGACATAAPPKELVDARAEYTRSENGKARSLNPAGLHEAKVALDKAEQAYSNDNESTADLAYLALRRAQRAELEAQTADWQHQRELAMSNANQAQAKAAVKEQGELVTAKQQLETERNARVAAETRTKDVLKQLVAANAAAVKEEPRGTVISLSGGVLFGSGKSELLPGAQTSLGQIADAIKEQSDKKIVIEGHTDSRGVDASNVALSKSRADSVGSFLISHGVPPDRVTTAGLGSSRPVADNATPEGRANNRRVEIVIQTLEAK